MVSGIRLYQQEEMRRSPSSGEDQQEEIIFYLKLFHFRFMNDHPKYKLDVL